MRTYGFLIIIICAFHSCKKEFKIVSCKTPEILCGQFEDSTCLQENWNYDTYYSGEVNIAQNRSYDGSNCVQLKGTSISQVNTCAKIGNQYELSFWKKISQIFTAPVHPTSLVFGYSIFGTDVNSLYFENSDTNWVNEKVRFTALKDTLTFNFNTDEEYGLFLDNIQINPL